MQNEKGERMRDETKENEYASYIVGTTYDAGMKKLMSNKEILIPVLQMVVSEFSSCTQEEILSCLDVATITNKTLVSDYPNSDLWLQKEDTEFISLTEKLIRFDIRFKAKNPKLSTRKIKVNLHIDLEAQKSYRPRNPSYPIIKRAEYYVARELSSQLGTVTATTDYSKLEKCYSIWICTEDIPKALQNTMTKYYVCKQDLFGETTEPQEDYDLMTVILIRQGERSDKEGIFDYLQGLFDCDITKIDRYLNLKWSEAFKEEVKTMNGFGEAIYQRGLKKGRQEAKQELIQDALRRGKKAEKIADIFDLPLEEIKAEEQALLMQDIH